MSVDDGKNALATYGTLAPGKLNHHQLQGLAGTWRSGFVRGKLMACGWGADLGFPGLVFDLQGQDVPVEVFFSDDLPHHWQRLDAFEGPGYRRVIADIRCGTDTLKASIYVLAE